MEPTWPDYAETIEAIRCAVAKEYGAAVAEEVVEARVQVATSERFRRIFNGRTSIDGRVISVSADAESAWSSALRHEFFYHRVPYVVRGEINPYDRDPVADQAARRMLAYADQCRRGES